MTGPEHDAEHHDADSDLRHLLDAAVSDVHPEGGPEQIRALAGRPPGRRWVPVSLAAAAATAVVIGGGAWLAQQRPAETPPAAAPAGEPSTAPTGSATDPETAPDETTETRTVETTVYFVGDTAAGQRLYPERREIDDVTGSDLQAAVTEVLSARPDDPDYSSPLADLGADATASVSNGTVTIDLAAPLPRPSGMDEEQATRALQALVWTADTAASVAGPVAFTVAGAPAEEVLGIDTSSPVERAGEDSVMAPVLVDTPGQSATVPTTFTVTGRAATFEANVVWELMRDGEVVRDGFTTAEQCCTLAPYSFEVEAPPGSYTLVVHDTDESDGEGIGISQDTKEITVE